MLLANINIELDCSGYDNNILPKEEGRNLVKFIGHELDKAYKKDMISFLPTTIDLNSVNLIVEVIGTYQLIRSGGVDWNKLLKDIKGKLKGFRILNPVFTTKASIHEVTFCEAAATILYCYKQDDYLIPDSDPHDVMGMENKYNDVPAMYHGRFLALMKLWCDCVLPTNLIITGGNVYRKDGTLDDNLVYRYQELEYKALLKKGIDKELRRIEKKFIDNSNRPFNRFYKALVPNRTAIHTVASKLIPTLRKKGMLTSNNYYVLDVMDTLFLGKNDKSIFIKLGMLLRELKGSTIVFYIDIPNHFLVNINATKEEQAENLTAEARKQLDTERNIDLDFDRRMTDYNIGDTDDSLDFATKTVVIRDVVNTVIESRKAGGKLDIINDINKMINNLCRSMNVIIAYSDTIAYEDSYLVEQFFDLADNISIACTELSPTILSDDILMDLGRAYVDKHFFQQNKYTENKSELGIKDFEKDLEDLVIDHPQSDPVFKSLYEFQFMVRESIDFKWRTDAEGTVYFSKLKRKLNTVRNKKLKDAYEKGGKDAIKEEMERQDMAASISSMMAETLDRSEFGSMFDYDEDKTNTDETQSEIELEKMIGLKTIKEQIKDFTSFVQLVEIRKEKDLPPVPISKHMVFMGNPGTAKTSVARQLGRILHSKGLLPTANLHQVARDDLVGKYVGWTSKLCRDAIEKAKGGILFVDEAYSLTANEGGNNSYGQEAVDTFVNYMDKPDVRDETIIIFAGYKEPMRQFIASNPGLKSRIGFYLDFPDYSDEELLEIAKVQADHHKYKLSDEYLEKLKAMIQKERGAKDFANGRFVRGIFEKSVIKQSRRLMQNKDVKSLPDEAFALITGEDFSIKGMDPKEKKKPMGFQPMSQFVIEDDEGNIFPIFPPGPGQF